MEFKRIAAQEMAVLAGYERCGFALAEAKGLSEGARGLLCETVRALMRDENDWVVAFMADRAVEVHRFMTHPFFAKMVRRVYEHGAARGCGASACALGMLHYAGEGVEKSYSKALSCYRLGARLGDMQACINLGYCFYYGHGTKVDYAKAYECFARAAFNANSPEGLWKLGDMYRLGIFVSQDEWQAWLLYAKAYALAEGTPFDARAAHHCADYLMVGIPGRLEVNPLRALELYGEAERGYYAALSEGLEFYRECLDAAIAGQEAARSAVRSQMELRGSTGPVEMPAGLHVRGEELASCA